MILILGLVAIFFAILNVYFSAKKTDSSLYMGLSLSFTILVLITYIKDALEAIRLNDIVIIEDVILSIDSLLIQLAVASIIINLLPRLIFRKK